MLRVDVCYLSIDDIPWSLLDSLSNRGYVEEDDRAVYKITTKGKDYLMGVPTAKLSSIILEILQKPTSYPTVDVVEKLVGKLPLEGLPVLLVNRGYIRDVAFKRYEELKNGRVN